MPAGTWRTGKTSAAYEFKVKRPTSRKILEALFVTVAITFRIPNFLRMNNRKSKTSPRRHV